MQGGAESLTLALGVERAELRLADLVVGKIERGLVVVALDGEDLFENRLEAAHFTLASGDILL